MANGPPVGSSPSPGDLGTKQGALVRSLDTSRALTAAPRGPGQQPNTRIKGVTEGNFYSPQQPITPYGPPNINEPRWWDYAVGFNLTYQPRQLEPISFRQLRAIANSLGVLRALIETRKDQMLRIPWDLQVVGKPRDLTSKAPEDPRLTFLRQFFKKPDRQTRWHAWCRTLLDDLFVCDAATLYIQKSKLGTPYAISVIDGATIKPMIDDYGRRPDPPSPAFQQIIHGLPMIDLTSDELIYAPMHLRPDHRPYGYSPVEQIYLEILQALKREMWQLNYWTEGTIPDMIITVPKEWTPQQVAEFQADFDLLLQGNLSLKSKVRFMPGDSKPFELKGPNLKTDYDEWLIRILCFAFSIPPTAFVRMMNRGTAETAQEAALEEGLLPLMMWFKDEIMDPIIQEHFGWADLEFVFTQEDELDQLKEMQTITGYVKVAIISPDEGRKRLGEAPKGGAANELVIITASGATKLEDAIAMSAQAVDTAQNTEQRTQEQHETNQASAQNTEQRAQENHEQAQATAPNEEERTQEAHEKAMKEPPKGAVKKLDEPSVKKKLTRVYGSSTLIKAKSPTRPNDAWRRY